MITFEEQGLSPEILRAIADQGFIHPTPIQEKIIPELLNETRDIIGLSQTGSGKTASFGLPILQQIDTESKTVQALILCPTRELCLQITKDLKNYSRYLDDISVTAVYGGAPMSIQIKEIKKGSQIVVGTPGRTLDLIKRNVLKVGAIRWMVLDEADEMLNMGFREELDDILSVTPDEKQVLLFSATMPDGVRQIAGNYMNSPKEILAGKKNKGAENVEHHVYHVKNVHRFQALKRLIDIQPDLYGIVFCRTRQETKDLAEKLTQEGYNSDALHGDLSQAQRDQVMKKFRNRNLQVLVATDVAARGIDVNDLTHVLNFSLPDDPEVYIHRSGRTGRAGKTGISVTFAGPRDVYTIQKLEKLTGKNFQKQMIPGEKDILGGKIKNLIDKICSAGNGDKRLDPFWNEIYERFSEFDRDELIFRMVTAEFTKYLEETRNTEDLNADVTSRAKDKNNRNNIQYDRYHINLGLKHKLLPEKLIRLINENINDHNVSIGKIEILNTFSFFEIDKNYGNKIENALNNKVFSNVRIKIQASRNKTRPEKITHKRKRFHSGVSR